MLATNTIAGAPGPRLDGVGPQPPRPRGRRVARSTTCAGFSGGRSRQVGGHHGGPPEAARGWDVGRVLAPRGRALGTVRPTVAAFEIAPPRRWARQDPRSYDIG